jgi:GT2 family glycosyltransferase
VDALQQDRRAGLACAKTYTRLPSRTIMSAGIIVNRWTGAVHDRGAGRLDDGRYDRGGYVDACGGFAWLARREVLEALNGLDERFNPYGWEDVDFCLRAAAHGWRVRYVPEAIVYHGGGKVGRKPVAAYERRKVCNYFLLLRRHTTLLQRLTCLVCVPWRALLVMGRLIRQGHAAIIAEHWRGLWDGLGWSISSENHGGVR